MQPILLREGDTIRLKKPHPCGSDCFRLARVGSDVRLICTGCGRDLTLPRIRLEGMIRSVGPIGEKEAP